MCFPYSMAWLGQRFMQAMQWVQFFPQTGVPFVRRMLFRGQIAAHLPQDVDVYKRQLLWWYWDES